MACCKCCCGGEDCTEGQQGKCCCGGSEGSCCQTGEYCCSGSCSQSPCESCEGYCDEETPCEDELACKCCDNVCVGISVCCGACTSGDECPGGCYCCEGACRDEPCCETKSDCEPCECCVDGYCGESSPVTPSVVSVSYTACGETVSNEDGSFMSSADPFCEEFFGDFHICFGAEQELELLETVTCGGSQTTDLSYCMVPSVDSGMARVIYHFSMGACIGSSQACGYVLYGYFDYDPCNPEGGNLSICNPLDLQGNSCGPIQEYCDCYDFTPYPTIEISFAP